MTKTRFGSQRVILDIFKQQIEEQNNGTREPPPPSWKIPLKNSILFFGIFPLARATSFKVSIHWATATSQWVSVSVLDKDGELLYQGPVKSDSVQKIEWENMKIQ